MSRIIVGLGGLLSDPACCVLKAGEVASAVEQRKVSRQEHPGEFPQQALSIALDAAHVGASEIDCVAIARPFSRGSESDSQLELRSRFPNSEIVVVEHHTAHAASAYFASPFTDAKVLSIDRAGDFRSAVLFHGKDNRLTPIRELYFPTHSEISSIALPSCSDFRPEVTSIKFNGFRLAAARSINKPSSIFCIGLDRHGRTSIAASSIRIA